MPHMTWILYLATWLPQSFGQNTNFPAHSLSWAVWETCGISDPHDGQFTVLLGQIGRCWAKSRLYARRMHPRPLKGHSTTFISHCGRWFSKVDLGPDQLHPPGRVTEDGHLILFLPIMPSTARLRINVPVKGDLSAGQRLSLTWTRVIHSWQNECPSGHVTGLLKTPRLTEMKQEINNAHYK